jgi:predicted DNA binding CopG/RHH family protein
MKSMSKKELEEFRKTLTQEEYDELMKDDEWESGALGRSQEHVGVLSKAECAAVDDALGLQVISIRLQKVLIENLKTLAKKEGIGYQPLIRQILTRYVRDSGNSSQQRIKK